MARKVRIDMAGRRFGRLVGLAFSHVSPGGRAQWRFACDCGAETVADGGNVRAGTTASCGCLHRERSAGRLLVHGHRAAQAHPPTYRAWQGMNAGGAACAAWAASFPAFLRAMGERPPGAVLARADAARPFGPGNAGWVARASRAARAEQGWVTRRRAPPAQPPARAATSQSRSAPAAATIIRPSVAR